MSWKYLLLRATEFEGNLLHSKGRDTFGVEAASHSSGLVLEEVGTAPDQVAGGSLPTSEEE